MRREAWAIAAVLVAACSDPSDGAPSADAGSVAADAGNAVADASMQDASIPDAGSSPDATAAADAAAPLPDAWVPPPPPDAASGPFADAAAPCEPEAPAAICARLGADCGSVDTVDLCGGARTVSCGACAAGATCGGVVANRCAACVAESNADFCARLGKNCGTVIAADGCGTSRTVSCGTCAPNETCSSNNVCTCAAESDAAFCTRLGATCGALVGVDNCGAARSVPSCGSCNAPLSCAGGGVANVCGAAPVCAPPSSPPPFASALPIPGSAPFAAQACTTAQIGAFVDACLGDAASAAACESWRAAHAGCRTCLVTPDTAPAYGPFVSSAGAVDPASNPLGLFEPTVRLGVQACLDHFRSGCGARFVDHEACLTASCDAASGCAGASAVAVSTCRATAQGGACASTYAAAYEATSGACRGVLSPLLASLPGDACVPSAAEQAGGAPGQRAFLVRLATTFCGP